MEFIQNFIDEEDGMATIEVIMILAVLVAIGIAFKETITSMATNLINNIKVDDAEKKPEVNPNLGSGESGK